jgi:HK97 family phage portal protein
MGLIRDTFLGPRRDLPERADASLSIGQFADILQSFAFQGLHYTMPGAKQEELGGSYPLMARSAFKANGIVAACIWNRMMLFSEMRFAFRRLRSSGPAGLFSNTDLGIFDEPWPGATTGDLLSRMLTYHDVAGNAYVVRRGQQLIPLRPDWVTIIGGIPGDEEATVWHPDAQVLGYAYQEGGTALGKDPVVYLPEEVAHFATLPDPEARFVGMSWLTPVLREIMGDKAATEHKLKFFENGATPNLAVKLSVDDLEKFTRWIELFRREHEGVSNAYRTMFLAGGADVVPIGTDLQQLEFKVTQGAGETRIAAAAGVPPVVVGLSEGLAAATYSNYAQARRRFADNTIRPLWRNACGSLQRITRTPSDAQLWYDDRDVSALQEDKQDAATIQATQAQSIKTLIDAGYDAKTVVAAVQSEDFSQLVHTGLFSVQLQPPGSVMPDPSANGSGTAPVPIGS